MELLRHQTPPSSSLNPHAPAFIPMAYYDVVEDFSDQWWTLVHSSPCFRDYWLRECFSESLFPNEDDLLDSIFSDCLSNHEKQAKRGSEKELVAASAFAWNNSIESDRVVNDRAANDRTNDDRANDDRADDDSA